MSTPLPLLPQRSRVLVDHHSPRRRVIEAFCQVCGIRYRRRDACVRLYEYCGDNCRRWLMGRVAGENETPGARIKMRRALNVHLEAERAKIETYKLFLQAHGIHFKPEDYDA